MPNTLRPFRIGKKGNWLVWIIAGLGFCSSLMAFSLNFIPPNQIETGSNIFWFSFLILGSAIFIIVPFIIYANRKESWKDKDIKFEPFSWEK